MTKAEMQAELDRLRRSDADWRELAIEIRDALEVPYPVPGTDPEWQQHRYDRLNEAASFIRGVIGDADELARWRPASAVRVIRAEFKGDDGQQS